ncbi:MAG: molybdopterin-dependent oxidoreductase [Anaerolineales bacterium]
MVEQWLPFTCTLDCGSRCELAGCVVDGHLMRLDTPPGPDELNAPRLIPCARGRAQRRWLTAGNRVGTPWLRDRGVLKRAAWSTALDYAAAELERVRTTYGAPAILFASGAGGGGGRGFSGAYASERLFSYWDRVTHTTGNLSHHCASWVEQLMLGRSVPGSDRLTLLDAQMVVLWGNNPADTHMGAHTEHYLRVARDRGTLVILIDPRLSDSGALADVWLPVRPGTDVALVAALVFLLESWDAVDRTFLERCTAGYELYRDDVLGLTDGVPKTPAWASTITGLPAERIEWLARQLVERKPATLLPGWGPQRAQWGEQFHRAMITLACVTGNVGQPGTGLPGVGSGEGGMPLPHLPSGPYGPARTLHNGSWAQAVLAGDLHPPLKLAFIAASNLVNRSSDTNACLRALDTVETTIVLDPFLTPTAQLADVVLPINTDLERADIISAWGSADGPFDAQQVTTSPDEAQTDYWVCAELAQRLGIGEAYTGGRTAAQWLAEFREIPALAGLQERAVLNRKRTPRVALADYCADPLAHPLPTASGRIELASYAALEAGLPLVASFVPWDLDDDGAGYPLHLLTPHHKLRANSCHAGNPWLRQIDQQALWIHPANAAARGIADGDRVAVRSPQGVLHVSAYVTERIMPGVVCLPQGAWFAPDTTGIDQAGSANVLTSLDVSPSGGPTTHSVRVEVSRVAG